MSDFGSRRGMIVAVVLGTVVALAGPIGRAVQTSSHPNPNANLKLKAQAPYDNAAGRPFEMTVTLTNPRPTDVQVTQISERLPAGFSYESDSTYGSIYDDPFLDGNTLRWWGPFLIRSGDSFTLIFSVKPPEEPGVYLMRANAIPQDDSVGVDRTYAAFHLSVAAPTELIADPVLYGSGGVSNIPRLSATLTTVGKPLAGHVVRFYAGGDTDDWQTGAFLCSATSNANGVASCSSVPNFVKAIQGGGVNAFFISWREPAPHLYQSSSSHAQIITDVL